MIYCNVSLTNKGFDCYKHIIDVVFSKINKIIKERPKEWFYEEYKKVQQLGFDNKIKERPVN